MALSFYEYRPRRLELLQARVGLADSWVNVPNPIAFLWRPESTLIYDYEEIQVAGAAMAIYKPFTSGSVYSRRVKGIVWFQDPDVIEVLVAASPIAPLSNSTDVNTGVAIRAKFNTGLNTNNFRSVTKTFQPVTLGVGYGTQDWMTTLAFIDSGTRGVFPLPWQLMLPFNTHFNTTDVNVAGVITTYSNS